MVTDAESREVQYYICSVAKGHHPDLWQFGWKVFGPKDSVFCPYSLAVPIQSVNHDNAK
jgi:hypothetical protein